MDMLLYLTSKDKKGQHREFFCQINKLEIAFDFLSDIVAKGSTITQAYILEDGQRTDLPIAVFDGDPFLKAIQELEKEWDSLLCDPMHLTLPQNGSTILLIQKRADQLATKINSYEELIFQLEKLLKRTQTNFSQGPLKNKVIGQYEAMLNQNRLWLTKAQVSHDVIVKRLNHLCR